ncbi:GNAT family N-acetyltransferase [Limnohabitans sp. Jir72]|uniref:GNAT family N-acetyltransferase n=1 Tax=Limnohabitans sp. Jir72 TaxID=1977909 RepID=UPI001304E0EF|nr:GNAT family N-acetyltransferase [Limnohabitans sp. Jir72]
MSYEINCERPNAQELANLLEAVGWGVNALDALQTSIAAYTETVCARDLDGVLVGYVSVFSDGVFTTMFGEVVVHPEHQNQGIGTDMFQAIEKRFPNAPMYVKTLGTSEKFFQAIGFQSSALPQAVLFKAAKLNSMD